MALRGAHDSRSLSFRSALSISRGRERGLRCQPIHQRSIHMGIDIGIAKKDREAIAKGLSKLLADTYTLYLKTHGFHWNITGPMFNTLHLMFETQYNTLWLALDTIAERIRTLDVVAPGSGAHFTKLS